MSELSNPIRRLFEEAREVPESQRTEWLKQNCNDPSLRGEIEELLKFDMEDRFLEIPIVSPANRDATPTFRSWDIAKTTLIAGRYKLLQTIGEGGFGIVYMADQLEPVCRRVAIKFLRSSGDSKSVLARFESERQALAMMDHPNIAHVYDGGVTEDGTPFFVMELVNGFPITDFCDANHLSNGERMKLLIAVCNAIQHAHQKGIIHRDLKPSNILVSMLDGVPIPKVIDFGIAKALHGPLTEKTLFTAFQQMIGTPEYMSPEQAETSIVDVDTRSDVFSLGVLAYELLTGTTPFDGRSLRKLAYAEIQRTIREVDPPKPSDRISTLGQQAATIATNHSISQAHLHQALRGDLDWIVMKAMEKDRNRRYGSAQSFADDLRRWLNDEPVEARPPSFWYRSSKFVRKHRSQVAIVMMATVGTVLAAMGLGYGLSERSASLERQRDSQIKNQQLQKIADIETDNSQRLRYGNAMIAANESFRNGRRGTTLQLLEECPADKRGIEWQWLSYLASDKSKLLHEGSGERKQNCLVYSHEDHTLLSAGADGMVRLWNTVTMKEMQSWRVSDEPIVTMAANSRDLMILLVTASGKVMLWDRANGQTISTAMGQTQGFIAATFSSEAPQSTKHAIGCDDGSIFVWTNRLENAPVRFQNPSQPFRGSIQSLEFSPDGSQLLVAGKGGCTLFEASSGHVIEQYGQYWQSFSAAFAADIRQIVMFGPPVVTVDADSLDNPKPIEVPSTGIVAGGYVRKDQSLIVATEDQCLRRIDLNSKTQETLGYCQSGRFAKLDIAKDGHSVAFIDEFGSLRILLRKEYASPTTIRAFESEVACIAAQSSDRVYALSDQGELAVWNAEAEREMHRQSIHSYQGFSLALDAERERLLTNGLDQRLLVWSTSAKEIVSEYDLALGARHLALHPNGKYLAGPMPKNIQTQSIPGFDLSSANSANLALWNLESGKVERTFAKLGNWAMKLRFSSDGNMLAAATISDGPVVWTLDSPEPTRLFVANMPQVDDVVFSRDGQHLIAAYHSGQVYVWDLKTERIIRKIVCHGDQISSLLITQDDTRIITASPSDPTLRVWDWRTGQKTAEMDCGLGGVCDIKFADDEHSLLIGGKDGRIQRLRIRPVVQAN